MNTFVSASGEKPRAVVSVLIPERGRPEQLDRLICSLIDTADDEQYEIIVFIDQDDPAWADREPRQHSRTKYLRRRRPPTLGEKLNELAQEARGDLLWFIANDFVVESKGWVKALCAAAERLPKGLGVVYADDPTHEGHTSYWALTRAMYEVVGFFAPPWFPYWFVDTWWDEVGTLTGYKEKAALRVASPDGRGKSHGLIDLEFWVKFFEETRPMRVRDAVQLMQMVAEDRKPDLSDLERRHTLVTTRSMHMRSPQFLKRWGDTAASPPSPQYAEVKEMARKLMDELAAQKPRRVRVAIGVPSGRSWEAPTATNCAALAAYTAMHGVEVGVLNVQTSIISHSRNKLAETVLEEKFDYIFWLDSDMEVPPDTIIRLLQHNRDIVGATYNKRTPRPDGSYETLGKLKGPQRDLMGGGLQEADLLPGGVLLVKMSVYEKITRPWYSDAYRWPGDDGYERFKGLMRDYFYEEVSEEALSSLDETEFALEMRDKATQGPGCSMIGEDIWFCRKAARAGFELWCDLDVTWKTKHWGTIPVTCKVPEKEELKDAAD